MTIHSSVFLTLAALWCLFAWFCAVGALLGNVNTLEEAQLASWLVTGSVVVGLAPVSLLLTARIWSKQGSSPLLWTAAGLLAALLLLHALISADIPNPRDVVLVDQTTALKGRVTRSSNWGGQYVFLDDQPSAYDVRQFVSATLVLGRDLRSYLGEGDAVSKAAGSHTLVVRRGEAISRWGFRVR